MLFMGDKFEQILETNQRHLLEQQNYHSAELQVHAPKALYVKKKTQTKQNTTKQKKPPTCEIWVNVRQGNFFFMEYCFRSD